jgi:hypothetical protein
MSPEELRYEQHFLQRLWNKYRSAAKVQYVRKDGWWVLAFDNRKRTYATFFLGRAVEEAQQRIRITIIN